MLNTNYQSIALRALRSTFTVSLTIVMLLSAWSTQAQAPGANDEILRHVKFLASDETTGRGVDTSGIKLARDYIAREFAKDGLQPGGDQSGYLQGFDVAIGVTVNQPSSLTLNDEGALSLNDDWTPLGFSSTSSTVYRPGLLRTGGPPTAP